MNRKIMAILAVVLFAAVSAVGARAQEEDPQQNPVAAYLAGLTGLSYEEVVALQKDGNGLGNIGRAHLFSEATGIPLEEVLQLAKEMGWGNLYKEHGLHPGGNGLGSLVHGQIGKGNGNGNGNGSDKEPGPPAWSNGGKDK
jgi:hypothetical protein